MSSVAPVPSGPPSRQEGSRLMIRVAHSPDAAPLFTALVAAYNQASREFQVQPQALEFEPLLQAAIRGDLVGISPDASLVLNDVERAWRQSQPQAPPLVGHTVRYATSPVVIAVRSDRASGQLPTGWQTLISGGLRWAHLSSLTTSSGLLALGAEFYAAAGTQKLERGDIDRPDVLQRVAAMEKSVARYGGESEEKVVEYLLTPEAATALDAMVLSEAQVVSLNQKASAQRQPLWHAVYPVEGTLMMDHPLTLIEHPTLSPPARRAFLDFARFLASEPAQRLVIAQGYRPASYQADLQGGPITSANAVNPAQPALLPLPSPGTLAAMRDLWAGGLKRPANILLVVDVSGSMSEENRLSQAKRALEAFVAAAAQKGGGRDRVGLDSFSSDYHSLVPVQPIGENRDQLLAAIQNLRAQGDTALFYAAWFGQQKLLAMDDAERINAVVLMTDGLENQSRTFEGRRTTAGVVPTLTSGSSDPGNLVRALQLAQVRHDAKVLLFTVGYGKGANERTMRSIASATGGQYYFADPANIAQLYTLIQENF